MENLGLNQLAVKKALSGRPKEESWTLAVVNGFD